VPTRPRRLDDVRCIDNARPAGRCLPDGPALLNRPLRPPVSTLDHLVVAATTLADGIDWFAEVTGATPQPGGKHVAMGTHNALMRLGERIYLEIIAIDPEGVTPARPRWFGLDSIALQAELTLRPRLVHWVARTDDIERAVAQCPVALGAVHPMARGAFRWRITIPDDGALPGKGIVPTLIQWDVATHPADVLPKSHVSIAGLAASHADPAQIRAALAALGFEGVLPVTYDREARLAAMLRTPRGIVTL
jgi:glyoxalase-like protein